MRRLLLLSILTVLAAGCASQAPKAQYVRVNPDQVDVHESVTSAPPRFEVIKRLQVDRWSSAIRVPTYGSQAEAIAAFRDMAAKLGGNGVINFGCYRFPFNGERLACNGTVVRFL